MEKKTHLRETLTGFGKFTWCFDCERVFLTEDWIINHGRCPNPIGCKSGETPHPFDWSDPGHWPRLSNRDYPDEPAEGAYYPIWQEDYLTFPYGRDGGLPEGWQTRLREKRERKEPK